MNRAAWIAIACVLGCGGPRGTTTSAPPQPTPMPGPAPIAQPAMSPPVEPDPAPRVDGDITDAWVNGIHVLIKRIPGAETSSTQLFIQGGVRNWSKADAGIEQLAIATATTGDTDRMNRDSFTQKLAEFMPGR